MWIHLKSIAQVKRRLQLAELLYRQHRNVSPVQRLHFFFASSTNFSELSDFYSKRERDKKPIEMYFQGQFQYAICIDLVTTSWDHRNFSQADAIDRQEIIGKCKNYQKLKKKLFSAIRSIFFAFCLFLSSCQSSLHSFFLNSFNFFCCWSRLPLYISFWSVFQTINSRFFFVSLSFKNTWNRIPGSVAEPSNAHNRSGFSHIRAANRRAKVEWFL